MRHYKPALLDILMKFDNNSAQLFLNVIWNVCIGV